MGHMSSALLLVLFVASAAVVWYAGVHLSDTTDVLSERLGLGSALGGLVLLAVATNLPELAITVSAAVAGDLDVAVGNILGGIAVQTVVLVVLDIAGGRRDPLTYRAAGLLLVLEGALVVALLAIVVMGTQLPRDFAFGRVEPAAVLIAVVWVVGLFLLKRASGGLPWHEGGVAPGGQAEPRGHSKAKKERQASDKGVGTRRAALVFGAASVATLVAGVVLERSGEEYFGRIGMSGVVFGATVLATATALPEISSGITSVRLGDDQLAVSDIFGGNAFLPVLFVLASPLSGRPALPAAHRSDIYLTALGALLTLVYMVGLIFRPRGRRLRMGLDSRTVLLLYALGLGGLIAIGGA
jgi:cation:H+ antiporter